MVDEKETPGFKDAGIDPPLAEKPPPDTETPSIERLAGMLPVFITVYEITTLSPGANGPTLKVAALVGRDDTGVNTTYDGPLVSPIQMTARARLDDPSPPLFVVCHA